MLSKDKGYNPLLVHLNEYGSTCRCVNSPQELLPEIPVSPLVMDPAQIVYRRCGKSSTSEHHSGRWFANCGSFAGPPDPNLLPSRQRGFWDRRPGHSWG